MREHSLASVTANYLAFRLHLQRVSVADIVSVLQAQLPTLVDGYRAILGFICWLFAVTFGTVKGDWAGDLPRPIYTVL